LILCLVISWLFYSSLDLIVFIITHDLISLINIFLNFFKKQFILKINHKYHLSWRLIVYIYMFNYYQIWAFNRKTSFNLWRKCFIYICFVKSICLILDVVVMNCDAKVYFTSVNWFGFFIINEHECYCKRSIVLFAF